MLNISFSKKSSIIFCWNSKGYWCYIFSKFEDCSPSSHMQEAFTQFSWIVHLHITSMCDVITQQYQHFFMKITKVLGETPFTLLLGRDSQKNWVLFSKYQKFSFLGDFNVSHFQLPILPTHEKELLVHTYTETFYTSSWVVL